MSKQTSSDKRAGRKYRNAKDRNLDREDKPQSDHSRRSDERKSNREKIRSDEGRKSRDIGSRRSNDQLYKPAFPPSNRQRHSDQRGDEQKRRTLDIRHHKDRERERFARLSCVICCTVIDHLLFLKRSREDDRRRQGRGLERRLSPMPSRRRDRPHRSRSPRERQPREDRSRDERLQRRQAHNRNRSSEKKEEITSSVPSDEEALDKLAQEVDKELAQRGISPKVPMATVDISSSDNGSSDEEEDISEGEETKGEDDSQRHNTEDGELAETDETSMTDSDDENDSPHRGPVIKSRMLRKAISGYGEGESDASSSPDQPRQHSLTPPPPPAAATPEDTAVDEKPAAEPPAEETISIPSIDPNLPSYYPALYGCRNVEEYEWLNRIEEGTYGVVYRAKDKRTGKSIFLIL